MRALKKELEEIDNILANVVSNIVEPLEDRIDKIIFNKVMPNEPLKFFKKLSLQKLGQLIDEHYLSPSTRYFEMSPTAGAIRGFLAYCPDFTVFGHISRGKISIEGVELDRRPTLQELMAFANLFHSATEFSVSDYKARCRYD